MVKDTAQWRVIAPVFGCKFIGIYENLFVKTYFTCKREQFQRFFVGLICFLL
ncbi:MAG: hypothetical protein RJA20_1958 [Bacteroidota bacterium]|jgi:hypothetical protein